MNVLQQNENDKLPLNIFRTATNSLGCSRNTNIADDRNGMNETLYEVDKGRQAAVYSLFKENGCVKPSSQKLVIENGIAKPSAPKLVLEG